MAQTIGRPHYHRSAFQVGQIWSGHLAFGLVTIPVRLVAAARTESITFHMIHRGCGGRLQQKLSCKSCGKEVSRDDTVKGYEEARDQYILIEPAELDAIAPPSSRTIQILQFAGGSEIDSIRFDASYYLEPDKVGRPAYKLLLEAMRAASRVAIAKLAMHHREHTVAIRPHGPGLAVHTLFYEAEVRSLDVNLAEVEIAAEHLKLAEQLIASMVRPFDPALFRDEYQSRVLELIESKRKKKPLELAAPAPTAPVINILDALLQSLERKPPAKAETASPAAVQTSASKPRRRAAK